MSSRRKSNKRSRGLGDTIAKVTKATGIDKLVHAVAGDDCGCEERREKLNRLFPYAQVMDAEQRSTYERHLAGWRTQPTPFELDQQQVMITLLEATTGKRVKLSRCGSCIKQHLVQLETIYLNSCENH